MSGTSIPGNDDRSVAELTKALLHDASELVRRELDLRVAQLVPLDLLVALAVGDRGQGQVAYAEQDEDNVVVELTHAHLPTRGERRENGTRCARAGGLGV